MFSGILGDNVKCFSNKERKIEKRIIEENHFDYLHNRHTQTNVPKRARSLVRSMRATEQKEIFRCLKSFVLSSLIL